MKHDSVMLELGEVSTLLGHLHAVNSFLDSEVDLSGLSTL